MLGDVTDPQLVRRRGVELAPGTALLVSDGAQVVVDRRAGLLAAAATLLPEHRPPIVVGTDPPRCPLSHHLPGLTRLIGQEPVPGLRIITVGIEQGVRPARLHKLGRR